MPRTADPAKRRDLLARVREYVIRNGLSDLSLRPLARAVGTSDRMLLYYFGTKERMVSEALALDERRPLLRARGVLETITPPSDPVGLRRFLEELWEQLNTPERRAVLPLYLEVMTASLLHPDRYGHVMRDALAEWKDLISSLLVGVRMPEERARTEATLFVDAAFGLCVSSLADDDRDRADAAFHTLLDRLEAGWPA